jgi:FtsP/CotA-like multicopper oxidase with cupredoxin domain
MNFKTFKKGVVLGVAILAIFALSVPAAFAQPVPGGTLVPTTIPKYVTPLVIPPVMNNDGSGANNYDIAVRQFQQQILPAPLPPTTVWSYGPAADPTPALAPDLTGASQFNYPAYTIETTAGITVNVRWINELVQDPDTCFNADGTVIGDAPECNSIPHILPLDQTLHWANPPATGCREGDPNRTDCATGNPAQYTGPVPIVTHVHGAHVQPHSDGYPEAWWLPAASNIQAGYATSGSLFDDSTGMNPGNLGYADYSYVQSQPATTLWYHDHSLGMTRNNVYAGPAGFWLIRGDYNGVSDAVVDGTTMTPGVLPGPAPVAGQGVLALNNPADPVRQSIREIPIAIQDRSFNADGSLFYPDNRAFFEGLNVEGTVAGGTPQFPGAPELQIPFVPDSDIAPTWNPEAFFNVMVVNGVSWPTLEVAPALYRLRLLNGCNSRFLNLALFRKHKKRDQLTKELSFFQIGAEQGFLPQVVEIRTGFATLLPGDGTIPVDRVRGAFKDQALLMGLAERADVIVDFRGFKDGDIVRMINTAPDAPFGGFPDVPADPGTTGQVMQFVVNSALLNAAGSTDATATDPYSLVLNSEPSNGTTTGPTRQVSLNEGESEDLCVDVDIAGNVVVVTGTPPACPAPSLPFAPKEALLGTVGGTPAAPFGIPLKWTDHTGVSQPATVTMADGFTTKDILVTENPTVGDIEDWEIYNFTVDGHPIHLHLVRFEVVSRQVIGGAQRGPEPWETGFKDTVIAYPNEITTVRSKFDLAGLYVWHCHIVEHEDNEMMRPYVVSAPQPQ